MTKAKEFKQSFRFLCKPIACFFAIYLVAMLAIMRADYKHIDDLGRVLHGYKGWDNFSRYISYFSSVILHADLYLTDISPLPQLLALFLLAIASAIAIYALMGKRNITCWEVLAALPLGISPYEWDCLVYKYDAPYMALSILASVAPFLFLEYGLPAYSLASIAGMLAMCTTYQASSGIYPMLVIFVGFRWWNTGKSGREVIRYLFASGFCYLAALGIFKLFLMKPAEGYVSTSLAPPRQILRHLLRYYELVRKDFKWWWSALICLLAVFFVFHAVRQTTRKRFVCALLAVLAVALCTVLAFGVYPAFCTPLYSPRAMYGFGCLAAFLAILAAGAKKMYPAKIASMCLSYAFFAFAFTLGNAVAEQDRYTQVRLEAVIFDLNSMDAFYSQEQKHIQLKGSVPLSPVIRNMPQNYQMLNRMIRKYFGGSDYWQEYYFFHYFDLQNVVQDDTPASPDEDLTAADLPVVKDTMYHTIRGDGTDFVIEIK